MTWTRASPLLLVVLLPVSARAQEATGTTREKHLEDELRDVKARLERVEEELRAHGIAPVATPTAAVPGPGAPRIDGGQRAGDSHEPGAGSAGPSRQEPGTPEEVVGNVLTNPVVTTGIGNVELHGSMLMNYVWNFNEPSNKRIGVNRFRLDDSDHNTFEITWAKLGFARPVSGKNDWDAGGRLELAAGRLAQLTLSLDRNFLFNEVFNVAQAYVDGQIPTPWGNPILVRLGRSYSWFGVESLDVPLNPNFSLSYLFNYTPFTTTGISIGCDIALGFRYTQYVVNGWDVVIDNNDAKTFGGQLAWRWADPRTTIAFEWIVGPEQNNDNHDYRAEIELDLAFEPIPGTQLFGVLQYGQEDHSTVVSPTPRRLGRGKWSGALVTYRQSFYEVRKGLDRFAFAVRLVLFRDQGGPRTGVDQGLVDVTATAEVHFTEYMRLGVEYRRDNSSQDHVFSGRRGALSREAQDTFSLDATLQF